MTAQLITVELRGGPLDGERVDLWPWVETFQFWVGAARTRVYCWQQTVYVTEDGARVFTFNGWSVHTESGEENSNADLT